MEEDKMLHYLMEMGSQKDELQVITNTNSFTQQFGLKLTDADARQLLDRRRECLMQQQRIEFGGGVLDKLIFAFCDSDFIDQDNYTETIARLQDIFYLYKNESMDELTDDELIERMREAFDGECQGSLAYLEETYLDRFAREIRRGTRKFIGRYQDE